MTASVSARLLRRCVSVSMAGSALAAVTVLSTTDPAQEYSAFYAELRAVAIPRLNRLILTDLPNNAQPLMADLLAIVALLGSAMQ